tara:strand:+ start:151 stop:462 length:312 start_codon:yes stop_codon:yes gene_type:complete
MRNALFLITESEFGTDVEFMDYCGKFDYLKDAREALKWQIDNLASKENVNELQPTMNFKDRFHFWVDGEKRHIVISKVYRAKRRSLRMRYEAIEKINDFSMPV